MNQTHLEPLLTECRSLLTALCDLQDQKRVLLSSFQASNLADLARSEADLCRQWQTYKQRRSQFLADQRRTSLADVAQSLPTAARLTILRQLSTLRQLGRRLQAKVRANRLTLLRVQRHASDLLDLITERAGGRLLVDAQV